MEDFWARYVDPSGGPSCDYWNYFAKRLVDLASIPKNAAILDIGTYDGNVLFKALKEAGPCGYGAGIDIDNDGLREGLAEMTERDLRTVIFAQMDAASLGFPPETYDSVLANFVGWNYCFDFDRMEFTAPDLRMTEIVRVLKTGGQVGIGFWTEQGDIDWIADEFKRYFPECLEITDKKLRAYSKENPRGYETILQNSGFDGVNVHVERTTFVSPDEETWWRQMKQAAYEYFNQIPDSAEISWFEEQIFVDLGQFRSPEGIHFDKTAAYAFGTKL